ncbi:MAG: hypothetical protein ACPL5F_06020, partial [Moorellaceae bacterium]
FAFGFIKFGYREGLFARFQAQAGLPCKKWGYTSINNWGGPSFCRGGLPGLRCARRGAPGRAIKNAGSV